MSVLTMTSTLSFANPAVSPSRAPAVAPSAPVAAAAAPADVPHPAGNQVGFGPAVTGTINAGPMPGLAVMASGNTAEVPANRGGRRSLRGNLSLNAGAGSAGAIATIDVGGGYQWRYPLSRGVQLRLSVDGRTLQVVNAPQEAGFGFTGAQGSAALDLGSNRNFSIELSSSIGAAQIPGHSALGSLSALVLRYQHICQNNTRCWTIALSNQGVVNIFGEYANRSSAQAVIPTSLRLFGVPTSITAEAGSVISHNREPAFFANAGLLFRPDFNSRSENATRLAQIERDLAAARNETDALSSNITGRLSAADRRASHAESVAAEALTTAQNAQSAAESATAASDDDQDESAPEAPAPAPDAPAPEAPASDAPSDEPADAPQE